MEQDQPLSHSSLKIPLNPKPPERNHVRRDRRYTSRRQPGSIPHFSRSPRIFTNQVEALSNSQRSLGSKLLILAPAFAFQFCVVLTSVFSVVNLRLLSVPPEYASVHLIVSAAISIALVVAVQKCSSGWTDSRNTLSRFLVCFTAYLFLGTLLVLIANVDRLFQADLRNLNVTGNATFSFPDQVKAGQVKVDETKEDQAIFHDENNIDRTVFANVTADRQDILLNAVDTYSEIGLASVSMFFSKRMSTSPLYSQILAFVGYVIMASAFSSGHFLMSAVGTYLSEADHQAGVSSFELVVAAFGGCFTSFIGAFDLPSISSRSKESTYNLTGQIIIVLSIAMFLLIGCTICSVITWHSDVIKAAIRPGEDIEENILIGYDRRPTRTAQEIYDECAALLGHRRSISYMEDVSPRNLPTEYEESVSNSISHSETAADDFTRQDSRFEISHAETSKPPVVNKSTTESKSCLSVLKTRSLFLTAILMFLLSSGVVSVEYSSASYLGHVLHDQNDTLEDNFRKGTRNASAGVFMMYLVFALGQLFFEDVSQKLGWKSLLLGVSLVSALTALAFAVSDNLTVFFTVSCVLGLVRLAMTGLHRAESAGSQIHANILWCMTSLSLSVSSAVLSPLVDDSGFNGASMYYSATCCLLGCVVLLAPVTTIGEP